MKYFQNILTVILILFIAELEFLNILTGEKSFIVLFFIIIILLNIFIFFLLILKQINIFLTSGY